MGGLHAAEGSGAIGQGGEAGGDGGVCGVGAEQAHSGNGPGRVGGFFFSGGQEEGLEEHGLIGGADLREHLARGELWGGLLNSLELFEEFGGVLEVLDLACGAFFGEGAVHAFDSLLFEGGAMDLEIERVQEFEARGESQPVGLSFEGIEDGCAIGFDALGGGGVAARGCRGIAQVGMEVLNERIGGEDGGVSEEDFGEHFLFGGLGQGADAAGEVALEEMPVSGDQVIEMPRDLQGVIAECDPAIFLSRDLRAEQGHCASLGEGFYLGIEQSRAIKRGLG